MYDGPNARNVSNSVVKTTGPKLNDRGMSDMVWAWGQFLDHDLGMSVSSDDFVMVVLIGSTTAPHNPAMYRFDRVERHVGYSPHTVPAGP
jgi:Animal haem peroxidase